MHYQKCAEFSISAGHSLAVVRKARERGKSQQSWVVIVVNLFSLAQ